VTLRDLLIQLKYVNYKSITLDMENLTNRMKMKLTEQIKTICSNIKRFWTKVVGFVCKRAFVLTYPLVVLALILIFTRSILVLLALIVWIIVFLNAKYVEE